MVIKLRIDGHVLDRVRLTAEDITAGLILFA